MDWPQLPSFHEIVKRFSLFSTSLSCNPEVGSGGSLDCRCQGCMEWHAFVEGNSPLSKEVQYEVFTKEHVQGLANYLLLQAAEYNVLVLEVLEVGAGSGRLSHHLNRYLDQISLSSKDCVVHVTASDSGERGLNGPNVNLEDALVSVTERSPHIVLVSWMPMGVDWTAHMRATPSVLEYILIGEMDDGICGDPWLTWGYRPPGDISSSDSSLEPGSPGTSDLEFRSKEHPSTCSNYGPGIATVVVESEITSVEIEGSKFHTRSECPLDTKHEEIPLQARRPFEMDGWVRVELKDLCELQICRTDERWSTIRHSHTVSFRRSYECT
ncbi:hypothetical protein MPTK1_2g19690 [Marchantia polymorpha subsp. ruderalis]|uniref:Uncharacterized protein n=1 Tax=Marchantia polymorpha TaxID=3197 RepID=A0A2R6WVE0_MARPO|nr:hypothetical protein MARPO_0055s0082 [Marchantia polymorpha]BBN02965.1 hypothetical protein Mp_2g19690 [Marchantia polymorpha subsp. ruderalis]|eukprot:PTQ37825.1 hypothetical protein MARPO_0055s0082 [Marchantia polymorpha]